MIQQFQVKNSEQKREFMGLGVNDGEASQEEARVQARFNAEAQLSESIRVYIKALEQSYTVISRINGIAGTQEKFNQIILSFSEVYLNRIDYFELGSYNCCNKFYVAIIAKASVSDYANDCRNLIPVSEKGIVDELFHQADSIYFKLLSVDKRMK